MTGTYPPQPEQSRPQESITQESITQESRTQERTQEAAQATVESTFIIRAYAFQSGSNPDAFWNAVRGYIQLGDQELSIDFLEGQVRTNFPHFLHVQFNRFLESYPTSANFETEIKRRLARETIKFSVSRIGYGSIDITTVIEHLDWVIDAFGLTLDTVTAILSANAPGALNNALGINNLNWGVTVHLPNIQGPPQQATERQRASGLFGAFPAKHSCGDF